MKTIRNGIIVNRLKTFPSSPKHETGYAADPISYSMGIGVPSQRESGLSVK
jgi:hypothetical protein